MRAADSLPPDEPLDRRVTVGLAKIGIALKQQAWAEAGERGLNPTQGQVLALLRANPSGLRLGALAEQLGVTAATTSDSVTALQRKGLVSKEPIAGDGRGVVVRLTPTGNREAAAAAAWPDFLLEAVGELSAAEQAAFLRAVVTMIRPYVCVVPILPALHSRRPGTPAPLRFRRRPLRRRRTAPGLPRPPDRPSRPGSS
jgi:DNA-binding MarR family transcriptional regulator